MTSKLYVIVDTETGKLWEGYNRRLSWKGRGNASGAWTTRNWRGPGSPKFRQQSRYVIKELEVRVAPKTRLEVSEIVIKNG